MATEESKRQPQTTEPTADIEVGGAEMAEDLEGGDAKPVSPYADGGPLVGTIWFLLMFIVVLIVFALADYDALAIFFGSRSMIALAGYLIMQVGLWQAEFKWDEEGSAAYLKQADQDGGKSPEELEAMDLDATIPEDELKAAFPVPWGFLIGWWVWGISYIFPMDGSFDVKPTVFGIIACVVCFIISYVASVPMSDAVMHRIPDKKKKLSLMFLTGWITLGVMSSLDASAILSDMGGQYDQSKAGTWVLCMLGPFTIILSQKILFESRKMGTAWEASGKPNFHPIVYNMGGPLFVLGWFMLWLGTSGVPLDNLKSGNLFADISGMNPYIPLFLNLRTWLAFMGGCAMVPVVRFLDFSHDEDGPWLGEEGYKAEGKVFGKWWVGTDGSYFGVFLESPWPFILAWTLFGFSSFFSFDGSIVVTYREILLLVNCILQGVDAGILIQANLYAGEIDGKKRFSMPFVVLFVCLAVNIGASWGWHALILSLPGAILIILGQKTVFGARKRGDYTMVNGTANPYNQVFVYTWGEVFFMMGWIWICWGMSMPE